MRITWNGCLFYYPFFGGGVICELHLCLLLLLLLHDEGGVTSRPPPTRYCWWQIGITRTSRGEAGGLSETYVQGVSTGRRHIRFCQ